MECLECGKEFEGRKDAKYCGSRCKMKGRRAVTKEPVAVTKKGKSVTDNVTDKFVSDTAYMDEVKRLRAKKKAVLHPIGENEVQLTTSTRFYLDPEYVPENVRRGWRGKPELCECPNCLK